MDQSDAFPIRIRLLQADFQKAHAALINWGLWSRDRRGIFPVQITPPRVWDEFKPDENEAYGEITEDTQVVEQSETKAERAEDDPYDELQGTITDERLHGYGGPSQTIREALRIAYVRRDIHEGQYARAAGCVHDQFIERLEAGLRFMARFV
jgi:hypothetical protein